MKKIITLILPLFLFCISVSAQEIVGSWYSSYFKTNYNLALSRNRNGEYKYLIGIQTSSPNVKGFISVEGSEAKIFREALKEAKSKYREWVKTAKENNVTNLRKKMDVSIPSIDLAWYITDWYFSSYKKSFKLDFMIIKNENGALSYIVLYYDESSASSNQYIKEKFYFVLTSEKEFNQIIDFVDDAKSKAYFEKEDAKQNLFR